MAGFVAKKGDRYYSVVDLGRENGKRRLKWHEGYPTKKAAKTALNKLLTQRAEQTYVEPSRLTLKDYLERWLVEGAAPQVRAKTLERYREILEAYVIPTLGARPLAKLTPLEVQALYRQLGESGRHRRKGRAPKAEKKGKAAAASPEAPAEPKAEKPPSRRAASPR